MPPDPSPKPRTSDEQLAHALRARGIDLVLDVGANRGQYALRLRREGFGGRIVSFEPLPDLQAELRVRARSDPLWRVHDPIALASAEGTVRLLRSAESDMSSLLAQTPLLERLSPTSRVEAVLDVRAARLDRAALPYLRDAGRPFLKLDVQGAERAVLEGAAGVMDRLVGIQLELSLMPLYVGEPEWRDLLAELESRGFTLALVLPGYYERHLARQLQLDVVLFRDPPGTLAPAAGTG